MKRWISRIGWLALALIIAYIAIRPYLGASINSDNFPLREKWSTRLQGDIQQITLVDEQTVIARTTAAVYAVDVETGSIRWRHWTDWKLPDMPVKAMDGKLFFTDGKDIVALSQADGEVLWQQQVLHPEGSEVFDVFNEIVAVKDGGTLSLHQADDGTLLWSQYVCRNYYQAYFYETNIYVPCHDLNVYDVVSGKKIWEIESDEIRHASSAEGVIYFPREAGITAFDLENQKAAWSSSIGIENVTGLDVDRDLLFVRGSNQVCALQRNDGRMLWCEEAFLPPEKPARMGEAVYFFNRALNKITALEIRNGKTIGHLSRPTFILAATDVDRQLMVSTNDLLIFGSVKNLFAYGN